MNHNNESIEKFIASILYCFYDFSDNFEKKEMNINFYKNLSKKITPAILDLIDYFETNENPPEEEIQFISYEIAKKYLPKEEIKMFFSTIYLLLLKQKEGPRFGSMVKLMGTYEFKEKLKNKIENKFLL